MRRSRLVRQRLPSSVRHIRLPLFQIDRHKRTLSASYDSPGSSLCDHQCHNIVFSDQHALRILHDRANDYHHRGYHNSHLSGHHYLGRVHLRLRFGIPIGRGHHDCRYLSCWRHYQYIKRITHVLREPRRHHRRRRRRCRWYCGVPVCPMVLHVSFGSPRSPHTPRLTVHSLQPQKAQASVRRYRMA